MDVFISSVVSILATVIVGWFFFWKQKVKTEITHFSINPYDIGEGLTDMFPDFRLKYKDNDLVGDVIVLNGGFINSGSKDISELDKKPIQLLLPDGCKVKATKVTNVSKGFEVSAKNGDSKIDFSISDGVLKSNDFFVYTTIIETQKPINSLHDELKIGPRRESLEYKNTFIGYEKKSLFKWPALWWSVVAIVIIIFLYLVAVFSLPSPLQHRIIDKKTNKEVSIYLDRNSNIYLVDEGHELSMFSNKMITSEQLINNYEIFPKTKNSYSIPSIHLWLTVIFISLVILIMVLFYGHTFFWNKKRRFIRALES